MKPIEPNCMAILVNCYISENNGKQVHVLSKDLEVSERYQVPIWRIVCNQDIPGAYIDSRQPCIIPAGVISHSPERNLLRIDGDAFEVDAEEKAVEGKV